MTSLKGKTLFITGAQPRHRPGDRAARRARRRQCGDRGQDRRAASEAAGTIYTAADEIEAPAARRCR